MALQNRKQLGTTLNNAAGGTNLQRSATIAANGDMMQSLQGVIGTQVEPIVIAADSATFESTDVAGGIAVTTPTGVVNPCNSPTAAEFISTFSLTDNNDSAEFTIINLSVTAGHIITFTAGTGVTLVGHVTLAGLNSGTFRVRKTGAAAVSMYRLA
jgi:hypothetical protein